MFSSVNNKKNIPHSRPFFGEEEACLAGGVIRSGMVAQGKKVGEFETGFCRKMGYGSGAAVSSGTAALHLALLAIGIKPGDEVIIPSYVCSALLHAVRYTRATPVVADIEADTYNIDPADVETKLTSRTRAMIIPHMFGLPADMDRLVEFGVPIIEDCAQAVGSSYKQKPIGSFGRAAIFSFYATKVMTTGEGGMVVSGSKELIDRIKDLRQYDKKHDEQVRYNYKMTDIQAAIGLAQLERLDFFIHRRREIAKQYFNAFKGFDFQLPVSYPGHIYFRYIIKLSPDADPAQWMDRLHNKGIQVERPVFTPIHQHLGLNGYPRTEDLCRRLISIPIYPMLTQEEIDIVIESVTDVSQEMSRGTSE